MLELFDAIGARWTDKNLSATITGGVTGDDEAVERTQRPYAVFGTVADSVPRLRTNRGKYLRTSFQCSLAADTKADAGAFIKLVQDALECAPLQLEGGKRLLVILAGQVRYQKAEHYHMAIGEFTATEAAAFNRNQG